MLVSFLICLNGPKSTKILKNEFDTKLRAINLAKAQSAQIYLLGEPCFPVSKNVGGSSSHFYLANINCLKEKRLKNICLRMSAPPFLKFLLANHQAPYCFFLNRKNSKLIMVELVQITRLLL